ncbi:MAG: deoxyribonuclease IV [bacterium]
MALLGAHVSISGGLSKAFQRLERLNGKAMQIFLFNQRQWSLPALSEKSLEDFRQAWEKAGHIPVAVHDRYLVNLASWEQGLWRRSIKALVLEIQMAQALGIEFLVAHPGFHVGKGVEAGLRRFVKGLDAALEEADPGQVQVLIETTSGQGSSLGSTFEEIAWILARSRYGSRLGVCFDTCHVFASGWDLRDEESYAATMEAFQGTVGLERIAWFHLNDSAAPLGSRLDRHAHIGLGHIGLEGFRALLGDARFRNHPMVIETPKGKDLQEDQMNLTTLRSFLSA